MMRRPERPDRGSRGVISPTALPIFVVVVLLPSDPVRPMDHGRRSLQ